MRAQHPEVKGTPLRSQSGVQLTLNICETRKRKLSYYRNDPWQSVFIRISAFISVHLRLIFVRLRSESYSSRYCTVETTRTIF